LSSYIINTDPYWFAHVFSRGIKNPVFWRKTARNPNREAVVPGNQLFFRVTKTNPPVIRGRGVINAVGVYTLAEAFDAFDQRLGYPSMREMISASTKWTSGIHLQPNTKMFCIVVSDFQVLRDIRTDTELANLGIDFIHTNVVTGKELDDAQTSALLEIARDRASQPVSSLVSFISNGAASEAVDEFNPRNIQDAREKIARLVAKRQGQPEFRKKLLKAYGSKCAISGSNAPAALEAAHVIPYLGPQTNHVSNGLLLRADLHTLFDLGLIAIDSYTMTVIVHPSLLATDYRELAGKAVSLPANKRDRPNKEALDIHRRESGL
jgi:hypothetical protein